MAAIVPAFRPGRTPEPTVPPVRQDTETLKYGDYTGRRYTGDPVHRYRHRPVTRTDQDARRILQRRAGGRPQGNSLCGLTVLSCVGDWVVTGVSKIKLEPAGVAVLVATLAIVVHIRIMAGPAPDCAIFRANIRLNRVCPIVQNGEFGAVRSQREVARLV